jgi:hypothetical protein
MEILRNAARCRRCSVVVESTYVHHYQECSCGSIAVDGGREYLRRVGNARDIEELSQVRYEGARGYVPPGTELRET